MHRGTLDAQLEAQLAQQLSIEGAPQIQEFSIEDLQLRAWMVRFTRSVAIKITMGNPVGAIELFKVDGSQFNPPRRWQYGFGVLQVIAGSFANGATSTLNPHVAQLLGLSANEAYVQTLNPARNWWELRIENTALFVQVLGGLNVSGLTYQNSSIRDHLESSPRGQAAPQGPTPAHLP